MIKHKELAKSLWFILFSFVHHEVLALLNCSSSWEVNLADKTVTGQGGWGGLFLNNLVIKKGEFSIFR